MSARGRLSAFSTNPLERKIPENPKYQHVRSTIDTGASISKYMEKMEEMKRNYIFRPDEIFKRMKITTFVQLIIQVADLESRVSDHSGGVVVLGADRPDTADREVARIQMGGTPATEAAGDSARTSSVPDSSRSRLEEVINGVGEIDLGSKSRVPQPLSMLGAACPYLLLDVREKDSYDECHIITAQSYPTAMLARSVNYETKAMLSYKNQPGKIIVMYDEDERLAHRACTTLVQRGYDNLFMLSGGLKVAYKKFPEGLITGLLPLSIVQDIQQSQKGVKVREQLNRRMENVDFFSPELIEKLAAQMDQTLSETGVGSRLSKTSHSSRASVASSSSSVRSLGRKPFKC